MEYSQKYFEWQKEVGFLGGKLNSFKFQKFIGKNDIVVDFGCGGGYLLKNLQCKEKKGIEVNSVARDEAEKKGLKVVEKINQISDNSVDVIISNHVLEHIPCPLDVITALKRKLKEDGKIIFVVPCQDIDERYKPKDVNQHLQTWNPMTLGTLFEHAGYEVKEVTPLKHAWPPMYKKLYRILGERLFHMSCYVYARLKRRYQVRIVATVKV